MLTYWSEQGAVPKEQRAAQGARVQAVEASLQPLKAAYEESKEALTTIGEDEVLARLASLRNNFTPSNDRNNMVDDDSLIYYFLVQASFQRNSQ